MIELTKVENGYFSLGWVARHARISVKVKVVLLKNSYLFNFNELCKPPEFGKNTHVLPSPFFPNSNLPLSMPYD